MADFSQLLSGVLQFFAALQVAVVEMISAQVFLMMELLFLSFIMPFDCILFMDYSRIFSLFGGTH